MLRLIAAHRIASYAFLVFLISFAELAWNINQMGISAPYNDPIAHIRSQDEAVYASAAIGMSKDSDWGTPKVMGRPFLLKPPLLVWLSAMSLRLLGLSLFSIRLPALLLGAAGVAAVFAWVAHTRSMAAGVLGGGILLLSPFWQTFSRLCLTDVLAASFAALALAFIAFDPQLAHRRTRVAFGAMGAASILSKSAAGILPFAALMLFHLIVRPEQRAKFSAIAESLLIAGSLAASWYAYQGIVHPQWLWADNVQTQLIGTGLHWDRNSSISDFHVIYYLRRLLQMDPVVFALAALSTAGAFRIMRARQQSAAVLAVCWAGVSIAALCAFQASNLPYVALVLPPICTVGALCGPAFLDRRPAVAASILGALLLVRSVAAGQPWSLRPEAPPIAGARAMRIYYALNRDAELISLDPDDEFFSLTIPIPRVRYCVLDPTGILGRYAPHYLPLGIIVTSAEFIDLPSRLPQFEKRLHEWGVDSREPIASTITMNSTAELSDIVRARPESDFYLPSRWLDAIVAPETTHQLIRYSPDRIFLLSRTAKPCAQPLPAIPMHW
jgi:4-amino-4-deoxy-L-arabinose transferase-like glycosyltransferase